MLKLRVLATFVASSLFVAPVFADLLLTAQQSGAHVIVSGSGWLNVSLVSPPGFGSATSVLSPSSPLDVVIGAGDASFYFLDSGPTSVGSMVSTVPDSVTAPDGPFGVTVDGGITFFVAPSSYRGSGPGDTLAGSMTFEDVTLAELGLTPGTQFAWTLFLPAPITGDVAALNGGGSTLTLVVVPEPSAFLYGGLISVLAGCCSRIKRRLA